MKRSRIRLSQHTTRLGRVLWIGLLGCAWSQAHADSNLQEVSVNNNQQPVRVVATADVKRELRQLPIRTAGRLSYSAETRLAFKTSGLVKAVYVDEGDNFNTGDLLATLDKEEVNAQVSSAESNVIKAKRDLQRLNRLYQKKAISLQQLQDAQTAVRLAEADLRIAQFNQRHSVIKATQPGRVLQRLLEPHELISAGTPAFFVALGKDQWVMEVGLADRDVVRVTIGDKAAVHFDAYPEKVFQGRVNQIAAMADPKSGTFNVKVELDKPPVALKSGLIGRMDIFPHTTKPLAFIPVSAMVTAKKNKAMVYAFDEQTHQVQQHWVDISAMLGSELAVRKGLDGVQQVVTLGAKYLENGMHVRLAGE
ncbi:efflux RND transporter periplasmic adaptor subunit [Zooshikella sp. RANM57]|uniref:efflux RND transporter periplasmic adaptor subunit n=1 Tax=Zooshikella sp. RANM57 TaxID=3425863 RepID=UPI003D6F3A2D